MSFCVVIEQDFKDYAMLYVGYYFKNLRNATSGVNKFNFVTETLQYR